MQHLEQIQKGSGPDSCRIKSPHFLQKESTMSYTNFTVIERAQLELLVQQGYVVRAIGRTLQWQASCLSREFQRNPSEDGYQAKSAQEAYEARRKVSQPRERAHLSWALRFNAIGSRPFRRSRWSRFERRGVRAKFMSPHSLSEKHAFTRRPSDQQTASQMSNLEVRARIVSRGMLHLAQ